MAILATISQNPNLFTTFKSNPSRIPNGDNQINAPLPIPIPKYPPKKLRKAPQKPASPPNHALKTFHHRSKYYKPIPSDGVVATDGSDRSIVLGESGLSYLLPGAPFEFQFSYSETPKAKPLAIREPAFLPFAPPTMPRPWTGKAPLKKSKKKRKTPLFEPFNPTPETEGAKQLEMPLSLVLGRYPKHSKTREEILGEPLSRAEVRMLIKPCVSRNRQVNLGRDGLTHNMLELVHAHWKRQQVCKVRCRGVPTVDMDNVCRHLEEKTGGKIIHRVGGVVYLFRGRNYDPRARPMYPIMLWKPAAPVYPKLIQDAPEGLTKMEADELRRKGQNLLPISKLAKNGIYMNLVKDVKDAFEGSPLVKIDCRGMDASDYKKIGAKLKELVPCVLLSFDQEQILMWRGKDWKSMYQQALSPASDVCPSGSGISSSSFASGQLGNAGAGSTPNPAVSSPRLMSLWKRAIESSKAFLLDEIDLSPDALLGMVEEFEGISQATEHSYPALIVPSDSDTSISETNYDDGCVDDNEDDIFIFDSSEEVESSVPLGSLPVDFLAKKLTSE